MIRSIRLRQVELEQRAVSKIVRELDRIGRDREQLRHNNANGFMYVAPIKKINESTFIGHIAGPDTERSGVNLSVKFKVTQNEKGFEQITLLSRDKITSSEQAMVLVKHAINKHLKELPKKPYVFDNGCNKENWHGFYLSYSGKNNKLNADFDLLFDQALAEGYFPNNFRETCREFGFNISRETKSTIVTNIESHFDQWEQM